MADSSIQIRQKSQTDDNGVIAETTEKNTEVQAGSILDELALKKKKKKKKVVDISLLEKELGHTEQNAQSNDKSDFKSEDRSATDLVEMDEGKKNMVSDHIGAEMEPQGQRESWHDSERDYTYRELLTRFYKVLREQNPQLADKHGKYRMTPPSIGREGNKKTIFANISDIAKRMHRSPEHVTQFLFAELGTNGSVDGNARLVIKGRFQQKQIENVLRRYISEYVSCKTCKSFDTILSKENRLYFLNCNSCGSRRSVQSIKTGFQAQVGKRKLLAAKQS